MGYFAEAHLKELSRIIELPNGAPSHDTIRRIFDLLDPEACHRCFMDFAQHIAERNSDFIAIDGKRVCNGPINPLHLVSEIYIYLMATTGKKWIKVTEELKNVNAM